ncbi:MAG TPA: hypothetical protein VIF60_00690 [Burkholderiaceae bacterium]
MRFSTVAGVAFALFVSLAISNANAQELSSAQIKEADTLVQAVEKSCLANTAMKGAPDALTRAMGEWISTAEVCGCQARNLREMLTPAVLAMGAEERKDFLVNFSLTKGAECTVPAIKKNFSESCESVFASTLQSVPPEELKTKLQSHGYVNADAYLSQTCGCLRNLLGQITTQAWVEGSVAQYNAYLERKRTGDQSIKAPETPFDGVARKCVKSLAQPLYPPAIKPMQTVKDQTIAKYEVPAGWENKPVTDKQAKTGIVLSLFSKSLGSSLLMSVAKREQYPDSAAFAVARRSALANAIKDAHQSDITSLKIYGKPAWRYEVAGNTEGYAMTYLVTIVENAGTLNLVLIWTTSANYPTQREALINTSDNMAGLQ